MALFFADLVREASWGTGTADLPLSGPLPGHRRFADVVPTAARFHYAIAGVTHPDEWETGEGEIGSGGALIRLPFASSAGGETVDFSAGLKTVALTANATWFEAREAGIAGIAAVPGLEAALSDKADAAHDHDARYAGIEHEHGFAALADKPATLAGYGITDAASASHVHDGVYQPLDAALTAIAGLATTAFGRAHLTLDDAAAARALAGLGTIATQDAANVAITGGAIDGVTGVSATDTIAAPNFHDAHGLSNVNLANAGTEGRAVVAGFSGGWYGGIGYNVRHGAESGRFVAPSGDTASYLAFTAGGFTFYGAAAGTSGRTIEWAGATPLFSVSLAGNAAVAGSLAANDSLSIAGLAVVGARRTGWASGSGAASRAGFDTASITTEALAERVKALIDDLTAHGLIGA